MKAMAGTVSNKRRAEIACGVTVKEDTIHYNRDLPAGCRAGIARQREKEKSLVPLRIDGRTTIMVSSDKCNEAYAEYYRQKIYGDNADGKAVKCT